MNTIEKISVHQNSLSEVFYDDCIHKMKLYPNNYFKLAIVDPPYFGGPEKKEYYGQKQSSKGVKRVNYTPIENWEVPTEEYFNELFRISENQIIWRCNYFNYKFGPGRIIWDKVNNKSSFSDCEIAYCSMHDSVRLIRYMWNGMMQGKSISEGHIMQGDKRKNEKRIHTTQKPVLLYKWQLDKYAKKGYNILDTHVGSGSLRIACHDLNFAYTGFEKGLNEFNAQEKRFKQHLSQHKLSL